MSGGPVAAIDIGTTKICAIAAERTEKGLAVLGAGIASSQGIRKGVVVSIGDAAGAIRAAVAEAETAAGSRIHAAIIGISGRHVSGFASSGVIGLQGRKITPHDRRKAIESARTVYVPLEYEVLHVIPTEFVLDGQGGISDPVGMSGVRLESMVHIITAHTRALQNLVCACEQAGIAVAGTVFSPLATATAVLTEEEKNRGVVLMDIGGGTTDMAYLKNGVMVRASVLGIGGLHLTNDLAIGLRIGYTDAESIKRSSATASPVEADRYGEEEIYLPGEQCGKISRAHLYSIIRPRCEELFELAAQEIAKFKSEDGPVCGLVITGGTALMPGLATLAGSFLSMPVRTGMPRHVPGMRNDMRTPAIAGGIGLALYAAGEDAAAAGTRVRAGDYVMVGMKERIKNMFGYKDFLEILHKKKKGVSYV